MAYDANGNWKQENDSVAAGVAKLTSENSPLMQQAKTQAAQSSNRRGLLNSSMATGAATGAMMNAAMPIASQDAQQTAQKNLSAQNFRQTDVLSKQDLASKEKIAAGNVAAHDRQYAMGAIAKAQENYDAAFMNIAKESNLPEGARNAYLTHLARLRDSDFNLVEQMYGIDLTWGTTTPGVSNVNNTATPLPENTLTPGAPGTGPLIQPGA
jgi:hypothetical protein